MPPKRSLIEQYLPVRAIGAAARAEKVSARRGHISSLHLWWARRPLAASRAAVYGALAPQRDALDPVREATFFSDAMQWNAPDAFLDPLRRELLEANDGVPPKVLDPFAGGGAIPLEALRLGCSAFAVDLNPVAHLIQLCTLTYPQRFGSSLVDDLRHWGEWLTSYAHDRLASVYPKVRSGLGEEWPVAYLWTRTVRCPNPALSAHDVPMIRQTWLVKRKGAYTAMRPTVDDGGGVTFQVRGPVGAPDELGFDPEEGSRRGSVTCHACGASVTTAWAKEQGLNNAIGTELLAAVVAHSGHGKTYVEANRLGTTDDQGIQDGLSDLAAAGFSPPDLEIATRRITGGTCIPYGLTRFSDLFLPRQMYMLLTLCRGVQEAHRHMLDSGLDDERARAVTTYLGLAVDRVADMSTTLCRWDSSARAERVTNTLARQALPMIWDFAESNPLSDSAASLAGQLKQSIDIVTRLTHVGRPATVVRGSATALPFDDESMDAVVTDPPYYDNIAYADLADFFYIWLKRSVGPLYPEHFSGEMSPRRREAIVARYRHDGDQEAARAFYEDQMQLAFEEAHRVLKKGAPLVCVYAHKTTLGWATLVRSLQRAGFTVTEAWPLDTEMPERVGQMNTASLASSIFLVARKRTGRSVGEADAVVGEVRQIVAERVKTLQGAGIAGADLVIAAVGAGLRAYTQHERVERSNGEELDPESYLQQVQGAVLEAWGKDLGVSDADRTSRFYVFATREFGHAAVPFDEVNTLARGAGVELSGPKGLTKGDGALVSYGSKRSEVRVHDFLSRGDHDELGMAGTPLIDVLHRLLWLRAHDPQRSAEFLMGARPDVGRLKVLAHALAGPALDTAGNGLNEEQKAIQRLLAAWPQVVDRPLESAAGQQQMSV